MLLMPPFLGSKETKREEKNEYRQNYAYWKFTTDRWSWLLKLEETRTTNENCFHPQIENSNWP